MAAKPPASPYTAGTPDPLTGPEPEMAPPTVSEWQAMRQAIAELQSAREASSAREARLQRELEENQAIVQRMLADGNNLDMVAIDAKRRNREAARRRIYAHVAGKQVVIQLHADQDVRKNYPVHVNVNGKYFDIPRGQPFELPGEFLEALDHAYVDHVTSEIDEHGNPRRVHYDLFSYPYQVLRGLEGCESEDVIRSAA